MVGRNDPCICGSGKEFKKCCMNMILNPMDLWKERALLVGRQYLYNDKLVNTFFEVLNYSLRKHWNGACHTVSSILFIILKAQEIDCVLQLGFVETTAVPYPFCHSWITIEGEVFDIALYRANSIIETGSKYIKVSSPIFQGTDLETNNPTLISFGVTSNQQSPKREYQMLSQMTLGKYMEGPNHNDDMWIAVAEIAERINLSMNIQELKARYVNEPYSHNYIPI